MKINSAKEVFNRAKKRKKLKQNNLKEVFRKYKKVQRYYQECNIGEIINARYATKEYGVDFNLLDKAKHCQTVNEYTVDNNGIRANLEVIFTDSGIKKLIKTNAKVRAEIERLYEEWGGDANFDEVEL